VEVATGSLLNTVRWTIPHFSIRRISLDQPCKGTCMSGSTQVTTYSRITRTDMSNISGETDKSPSQNLLARSRLLLARVLRDFRKVGFIRTTCSTVCLGMLCYHDAVGLYSYRCGCTHNLMFLKRVLRLGLLKCKAVYFGSL